jgi:hypothetical protein
MIKINHSLFTGFSLVIYRILNDFVEANDNLIIKLEKLRLIWDEFEFFEALKRGRSTCCTNSYQKFNVENYQILLCF